jgi:hypothetical protein
LILSTDSVQLNGELRLGVKTGNNAWWGGGGVDVGQLLNLDETIFMPVTLVTGHFIVCCMITVSFFILQCFYVLSWLLLWPQVVLFLIV